MKRVDSLAEVGRVRVADARHRHELRHARRRAEAQSGASGTYKDLSFGRRYRYAWALMQCAGSSEKLVVLSAALVQDEGSLPCGRPNAC